MQRKALEGSPVQGIRDSWVRSLSPPPSSLPQLRKPSSSEKRPFLRVFLTPIFEFPVSADNNGLSGGFLASGLCIQKFRSPRLNLGLQQTTQRLENLLLRCKLRAASEPIADAIRGFRTVGSIPRER